MDAGGAVLANAPKPLVVDDAAYVYYARQILADPRDPYGFEIHWNDAPQPAFEVVAPPVLPYWLAGSMALFGDEPPSWKLALLPFALALTAALRSLLARFAPELAAPLLWMAVLSPSIFPFLNLMLDVPALALALSALAVFLRACERGSGGAALAAGALAGLAMQTKYTGVTALAALLVAGLLRSRPGFSLRALLAASAVFWGWEGLLALRYGHSHFVQGVFALRPHEVEVSTHAALHWLLGLLALLGATAPAVGVLGLAALGAGRRTTAVAAVGTAAAVAAIALLPGADLPALELWPRLRDPAAEQVLFTLLGAATVACVLAVARQRLRAGPAREDLLLLAWLAFEALGSLGLAPYLAARRVLGLALVSLLLFGRALLFARGPSAARGALRAPLALGVALAVLFAASDFADAVAVRDSVRLAEGRLRELGFDPQREEVWFVGHWGFQFYAERAGMRAVAARRSRLRRGDWLVIPHGVLLQPIATPGASSPLAEIDVRSASPWSTNPWAYAGAIALRPRSRAHVRVSIHRVLRDFVPPRVARQRAGDP
jgi:hypothetical protein